MDRSVVTASFGLVMVVRLLRDGTVVCGGSDREGQLADGEAPPEEARPVLVAIPAER